MRKTLLAIAAAALASSGVAHAKPVHCFLNVNGKVYIDNICDYDEEKDGSFTIGANGRSRYFAYVFPDSDSYWNGEPTSTHAHVSLGVLSKSGACWANDHAKVCAWKIGESNRVRHGD